MRLRKLLNTPKKPVRENMKGLVVHKLGSPLCKMHGLGNTCKNGCQKTKICYGFSFVISCFILKFCPQVSCFAFHFLPLCGLPPFFSVHLCPVS